jgi:hypothetical protein
MIRVFSGESIVPHNLRKLTRKSWLKQWRGNFRKARQFAVGKAELF